MPYCISSYDSRRHSLEAIWQCTQISSESHFPGIGHQDRGTRDRCSSCKLDEMRVEFLEGVLAKTGVHVAGPNPGNGLCEQRFKHFWLRAAAEPRLDTGHSVQDTCKPAWLGTGYAAWAWAGVYPLAISTMASKSDGEWMAMSLNTLRLTSMSAALSPKMKRL